MTDDGTKAKVARIRQWVLTLNGAIALVSGVALIIGFFIGSPVGRIICGLILLSGAAYFVVTMHLEKRVSRELGGNNHGHKEEMYSQPSKEPMKKLLFDDFQSSGGKYVVKEVGEESAVIPSSKMAQPVKLKPETVRELEILDFFDLDSDTSLSEAEPKSEFHNLVNKVLLVLKDVLFAHTVAFFWVNRDKQQMVLESMATDSPAFMTGRRFSIEGDLVSQVAKTGKAQVVGEVSPSTEKELLPYYESPASVQSVLGVPVFYMDRAKEILPVGVIIADSKAEDAFGQETLTLLGRFTKLISALVKSYTDKYDLLIDSELLTSLRRMQDRIKSDPTEQGILNALAEEANRLASWEFLTVAMYAEDRRGWALQKVVNKTGQPYVAPDQVVDIAGTVVGDVIRTNSLNVINDLNSGSFVRFHKSETSPSAGSFVCMPISSFNRCYGAMTLESKTIAGFSGKDVETLFRLVEHAASALEVVYMNNLVREHVPVDQLTGTLTHKHFLRTMEEEVQRAEELGTELSFVSIAVDAMTEHATRYGRDGCDTILNEVARILRANIRRYDVLGRQEDDRLGVLLINTPASESYLWAEKIRKTIASHVIRIGTKTLSVTVSAGVCGLTSGMQTGELVAGTTQVLGKALQDGGNLVRVF
jgi:diguanylate cyclase (GGDEF)-like protein